MPSSSVAWTVSASLTARNAFTRASGLFAASSRSKRTSTSRWSSSRARVASAAAGRGLAATSVELRRVFALEMTMLGDRGDDVGDEVGVRLRPGEDAAPLRGFLLRLRVSVRPKRLGDDRDGLAGGEDRLAVAV